MVRIIVVVIEILRVIGVEVFFEFKEDFLLFESEEKCIVFG